MSFFELDERWPNRIAPILNNRNFAWWFFGAAFAYWMCERPYSAAWNLAICGLNIIAWRWLRKHMVKLEERESDSWRSLATRTSEELKRCNNLILDYQKMEYVLMERDGRYYKCYEIERHPAADSLHGPRYTHADLARGITEEP